MAVVHYDTISETDQADAQAITLMNELTAACDTGNKRHAFSVLTMLTRYHQERIITEDELKECASEFQAAFARELS